MTVWKVAWVTCAATATMGGLPLVTHDKLFSTKDAASKFSESIIAAGKILEGGLYGTTLITDIILG